MSLATDNREDTFDLSRFVRAQESIYDSVRAELAQGRKRTHWMWFVFPQIAGLGSSEMSRRYAISGIDEARAYLAHPVLGERLRECAQLVLSVEGRTAHDIFGDPDDQKLQSSMTLFARADGPGSIFSNVLDKYFGREEDTGTLRRLE